MDRNCRLTDKDIGVISPYNAQAGKLRKRLKTQYEGIKVGSVEDFQGQERRVIVLTTVRTDETKVSEDLRHTLGFLVNPRRMNVALTRAQALLVVVGNPNILGLDPLWRRFLTYVHTNGGWKGLEPSWDPTSEEDPLMDSARAQGQNMEDLTRRVREMLKDGSQDVEDEDDAREMHRDRPWRREE